MKNKYKLIQLFVFVILLAVVSISASPGCNCDAHLQAPNTQNLGR